MITHVLVRKDAYFDSVFLMRISREMKSLQGVNDAVVAMATPHNKALLADSGYAAPELTEAGPNDLVIAVRLEDDRINADALKNKVEGMLQADARPAASDASDAAGPAKRPRSLEAALQSVPDANLALISVPGAYAAREARRALALDRHVMLFSDNVSVEDEIALKREAVTRGLLMMGPDCGTAIINGKPLAFANVVRRGGIGVVGASGTGIQEITCCIDRLGGGITQAIGTGGRDLSDRVGGLMTLLGIEALAADAQTQVLVIVSKPPSPAVASRVVEALKQTGKPAVVHFVGAELPPPDAAHPRLVYADTLAGAAEEACRLAGIAIAPNAHQNFDAEQLALAAARLRPGAKLRGLFCGGTTGHEALVLLERKGFSIHSNLHHKGPLKIRGTDFARGHVVLDLGADEFTVGHPHPMIEPALRNERLAGEMKDPEVGILLFDLVLGYGSHPDPAGVLAEGLAETRRIREHNAPPGHELIAIASITGTWNDPQGFEKQRNSLAEAGVIILPDNRRAVAFAASLLERISK